MALSFAITHGVANYAAARLCGTKNPSTYAAHAAVMHVAASVLTLGALIGYVGKELAMGGVLVRDSYQTQPPLSSTLFLGAYAATCTAAIPVASYIFAKNITEKKEEEIHLSNFVKHNTVVVLGGVAALMTAVQVKALSMRV